MRSQFAQRLRKSSISAVPPPRSSSDYSERLARSAASILYRSPLPSQADLPVYVLNAAAFPDARETDYDALLPYVLARLPSEEELLTGTEYEVVFFAGGGDDGVTSQRRARPGWGWFIQAYYVLSRAMRKRLQRLYVVHERSWVRILVEMFSTIVSPKFRRKIVHVSTLSSLALHVALEDLLIPSSAYLYDRRLSDDIYAPYASGRRAFGAKNPLPKSSSGRSRLPRVLRETSTFLLMEPNVRTEGLFRVPPHHRLREVLREAYDRGQKYIVWKDNGVTLPVPDYDGAEPTDAIVREVDPSDAYGVHLAAGLIKNWYTKLRQPVFPQSCYRELKRLHGDIDEEPSREKLIELVSLESEWSILPRLSREILIRHLLPLLSRVASYEDFNKMSPENLSICFAPALVCGQDQLEDAKMSSIIRRLLAAAVEEWPNGLRNACGVDEETFDEDLRPPADMGEYEDPLEDRSPERPHEEASAGAFEQQSGIILQDNEAPRAPPPLPPRRPNAPAAGAIESDTSSIGQAQRRKPAPPLSVAPPRYSVVIGAGPSDEVTESPGSYSPAVPVADGFRPSGRSSVDKESPPGPE
ncbi:divergent CRAL/TRIO domain-containing protein [Lineolata rhizophorae]|uniref:Divergent CRAL/TRIO domain-containing protein n=1 Tax=Lineolata rhizophorae TaxID=578093 RepID=A0A6A6PCM2_9PEZI|nr:divergent CRAL/TRIO domain-containing protein [Lineolata rhizophorae]